MVRHFILPENDWVPNNPVLPVIVHEAAVDPAAPDPAAAFEALFATNDWPAQWRDTVYDYHHYHSTTHEALGVFTGTATLVLGGPGGRRIEVTAGDALILPAGTGHRRERGSDDFQVVGAYPRGARWDLRTAAPDDAARRRMAALPVPMADPVWGRDGALTRLWRP